MSDENVDRGLPVRLPGRRREQEEGKRVPSLRDRVRPVSGGEEKGEGDRPRLSLPGGGKRVPSLRDRVREPERDERDVGEGEEMVEGDRGLVRGRPAFIPEDRDEVSWGGGKQGYNVRALREKQERSEGGESRLPGLRVPVEESVGDGAGVVPVGEEEGLAGGGGVLPVEQDVSGVRFGGGVTGSGARKPLSTPERFVIAEDVDWHEGEEEEERAEKFERAMEKAREGGVRVTGRDVRLFEFLGRYRYATHHQVARYWGTSKKAASLRLHKLAEGGLVWKREVTHGRNVWLASGDGLAIAGLDFRPTRPRDVSFTTMAHELGLVNLGLELELGGENVLLEEEWPLFNRLDEETGEMLQGERVLTTREIRQGQARVSKDISREEIMAEYDGRMKKWVPGDVSPELLPGNAGMFIMYSDEYKDHPPDMVVMRDRLDDGSPQSIAIELELTHKSERDLIRILMNYKESVLFGKLYYFCHQRSVARSLVRVNESEVGLPEEKFKVLKYTPTQSSNPFWG